MRTINFQVLPPPQILRRDIECLRITSHKGREALEVKVCPSGFPGIVFNIAVDASAAIESIATRTAQTSNIPRLFMHDGLRSGQRDDWNHRELDLRLNHGLNHVQTWTAIPAVLIKIVVSIGRIQTLRPFLLNFVS